jgi:hypothetical protein
MARATAAYTCVHGQGHCCLYLYVWPGPLLLIPVCMARATAAYTCMHGQGHQLLSRERVPVPQGAAQVLLIIIVVAPAPDQIYSYIIHEYKLANVALRIKKICDKDTKNRYVRRIFGKSTIRDNLILVKTWRIKCIRKVGPQKSI